MRLRWLALPLLLFAACGGSGDAMAGSWSALARGAETETWFRSMKFDGKGDRVFAHLNTPDGCHHPKDTTYTFDPATRKVVVKGKLLGEGKAEVWSGTVDGDLLELTGGPDTIKVKRSAEASDH